MAVGSSFKQKCPSCETMVAIKDASLVGKKVECSKCKYRFVVESPAAQDKAAVAGDKKKPAPAKANGAAKPPAKKRFRDDEDEVEVEEKPKAKAAAAKKSKYRDEDDDDDAPKKKAGGSSKLVLGLVLGGVGVVVLGAAAVLMLMSGGGSRPANPNPGPVANNIAPPPITPVEGEVKKDGQPAVKAVKASKASGPSPALTNLLPNDTEHVFHLFAQELFAVDSPIRDAVFQAPGTLIDEELKKRLGFSPLAVDDLIRAERFTSPAWNYTVVHLNEPVDEQALTEALGLEKKDAVKGLAYFEATKPNPWFDQLARVAVGVPTSLRLLAADKSAQRNTFVRIHDPQTLIFADQGPLLAFLRNGGRFTELTPRPVLTQPPAQNNQAPGTDPMMIPPGMMPPMGSPSTNAAPAENADGTSFTALDPTPIAGAAVGQSPAAMQARGGGRLANTSWEGSETLAGYGKLRFEFQPGGGAIMVDAKDRVRGSYSLTGDNISIRFGPVLYSGTVSGNSMSGTARDGKNPNWNWNVTQQGGGNPGADPAMQPGTMPPMGQPGMPPGTMPPMGQPGMIPPMGQPGMMPPMGQPGMMPPGMMPPMGDPMMTPGTGNAPPAPAASLNPRDEMYLTIDKTLKATLDKIETRPAGANERVLFSYATKMDAAQISTKVPEFKDRVLRQPRQFWDVTYLVDELRPRLRVLGAALVQKDTRNFLLHNELTFSQEGDAKEYYKELKDKGSAQVARLFKKVLDHPVELPKDETPANANPANMAPGMYPMGAPGMIPPGIGSPPGGITMAPPGIGYPPGMTPEGTAVPEPKKDEPEGSHIKLTQKGNHVDFKLELVLDPAAFGRLHTIASLMAVALRSEMDLAAGVYARHDLARAAKETAEKGLSEREVPPGRFPPAAFPRIGAKTRPEMEPKNRISWMAGLLPYLGREALYNKLNFEAPWRDPSNWLAGRTLVPQFVDPRYPDAARQVSPDGLPVDLAATHVVGIAGVGLDAADYPRDDPAFVAKRGVFGYDRSASLEEIQKGRGLANTAMMVQVPHDGLAGVTPWIAGGGATVRGVPEKNSIAPFVLSTDRDGKPIQHDGKRGTYVMMADGSVRFVDQNVSDDVFKAMATVTGPAPEGFDLDKSPATPKVPEPQREVEPTVEPERKDVKIEVTEAPKAEKSKAGWVTFKSPEGDYTVSLPSAPKTISQQVPMLGETKVHLSMQKQLVYTIASVPVPAEERAKFESEEGIKELVQQSGSLPGGKIEKVVPVTVGQHKGREVQASVDAPPVGKMRIRSRVILAGDRAIIQSVAGPAVSPADADRFFNSLKIGN